MVAVLLGVFAAGYGVYGAFGALTPPPPVIVPASKPANPTVSQSALFQFTDSQSVSFQCSLDGSSFAGCGSGTSGSKSYSGLVQGSHTFLVRAASGSATSSAASHTWVIDRTAPTASVVFPANGGVYNAAGYNAGCLPTGICGSAADPAGVASVRLSVKRSSTGKYWNGSTFSSSGETFNAAAGTTSWKYALALPPDDTYVVHVQATDSLGNAQTGTAYAASSSFGVDTTPPPAPSISSGPLQYPPFGWPSTSASFQFTDSESGVSFLCSLDGGVYAACSSPKSYAGLLQGPHTFRVEAKDGAGNVSGPSTPWTWFVDTVAPNQPTLTSFPSNPSSSQSATFAWTDTDPAPGSGIAAYACKLDGGSYQFCSSPKTYTGLSFASHTFSVFAIDWAGNTSLARTYTWTVSNSTGQPYTICPAASPCAVGPLYPGGAAAPINVTFSSPNAGTGTTGTQVSNLTVSISSISGVSAGPNPCTAADYVLTQFSGGYPFYLPFGSSSLSTLGFTSATWPSIRMLNRADFVPGDGTGNQNACKGATVNLSFQGTP